MICLPSAGVTSFPDNHFIVGLGDTVQQFGETDHGPSSVQLERIPLLSGSQHDHFREERPNKLIRRFGDYGTAPHQFLQATGIAVSSFTDDIFVTDSVLNRVSVFSTCGQFRSSFQCDCSVRDIAFTRGGTLLVAVSKAGNSILHEYTVDGRLVAEHGSFYSYEHPFGVTITSGNQPVITGLRQNSVHVLTTRYKPSVRFGSRGRGANHFTSPYFVSTNSKDDIIVSDCGNNRIKIHKADGSFIRCFGKHGNRAGELFYPMGTCVDKYDNIYVADANNYRVQVFSPFGDTLGVPVKNTYEYGIDVKPVNVAFSQQNVLLVVLRGSKYCQVHAYVCDTERYKPLETRSLFQLCVCCTCV